MLFQVSQTHFKHLNENEQLIDKFFSRADFSCLVKCHFNLTFNKRRRRRRSRTEKYENKMNKKIDIFCSSE